MSKFKLVPALIAWVLLVAVPCSAQLLGVSPGHPGTTFNSTGLTVYDAATGLLTVTARPLATQFTPVTAPQEIVAPRSLTISILVNSAGNLVGGVVGPDFQMTGTVLDEDGAIIHAGVLLEGEVLAFGHLNSPLPSTTDLTDFRFQVTGGLYAPLFGSNDIGVVNTIEHSSFAGSFESNWTGGAKGNVGPVPPLVTCTGSIGDFVWHDVNRNGVQDPGEPGINGVKVTLTGPVGVVTTTTGSNPIGGAPGYYQFSNLCAGTYAVDVDETTVGAFAPTAWDIGNDAFDNDSDGGPVTVILPTDNTTDQTIDFGFESACTGRIGDFVWNDLNQNGRQDADEPGISNVLVHLEPGNQDTTTGPNGEYQFGGLCAGTYTVTIPTPPAGMIASPSLAVVGDLTVDSNGSPTSTVLMADDSIDVTLDFGFYTPCTGVIGDFVWNDLNRDGIQDAGEPGIMGVRVILKDGFGVQIADTFTDPNGYYAFNGLCAGDYQVLVDSTPVLSGLTSSPIASTVVTKDSNPNPSVVALPSLNSQDLTIDFGYYRPCSGLVGNFVWLDANANGIQEPGEAGIPGVKVELHRFSDNALLGVTTTDADGAYSFMSLCAGDYYITVIPPAGQLPSPVNAGGNVTLDSNLNPSPFALGDFDADLTHDFGYFIPVPAIDIRKQAEGPDSRTVVSGSTVSYAIVVTNTGNVGLPNVAVTDAQVPGCGRMIGDLASGASTTYACTAPTVTTGFTNTACVSGGAGAVTVSDCDPSTVVVARIDIRKQAEGPDSRTVASGATVSYAIVVTNTGEVSLTNVAVTDAQVPGCAKSVGTLAVGASHSYSCTAPNVTVGFTNTACASGSANGVPVSDCDPSTVVITPPPVCVPLTFNFGGGSSAASGTAGNIRPFAAGGVGVKVSAYSETKPGGVFNTAYLGHFSSGLGVTDGSENGSGNAHVTDNYGRNNYILFEFSQSVTIDKSFLEYIVGDSDMTVWIGTIANAYTTHQTLSAALLSGLAFTETNLGGSSSRTAELNAGNVSGNILVIAAKKDETNDGFKVKNVATSCPTTVCAAGQFNFTGSMSTSGAAGNVKTFSASGVNVKASAFSRTNSTGAWLTAYLGAYGGGLGVTDTSEGSGGNNTHKVDNIGGRNNYILLEFDKKVVIDKAFLDAVGADSDISIWIGTKTNPYNNHLNLSDALLASLTKEDNATPNVAAGSRWADFNADKLSGNVVVISSLVGDQTPEDAFKLAKLAIACP